MPRTYTNPIYPYAPSADQQGGQVARHPVIVVGAGPVGLCAAIDLAQQQIPTVVLDDDNTVSVGSRAVCHAKRTLEILDRLGCGQPIVDKGVIWNLGKVFFQDKLVYSFNLQPESDHKRPAFINLQQYYFEEFLVERAGQLGDLDLRWQNEVVGVESHEDHVALKIETPDGVHGLECDYLIAADGAHSPIRRLLGLDTQGQTFRDRFLIADVVMKADFPPERWFWFDPPFHPNQSALLHRQADDVWRLDFQLGWDADPEEEKKPENVIPRVKAMLGDEREFELEWVSVYTFQCRRLERFRHGRVLFAGDAAHLVSPFGARGANGGIQDADNLAWKLKLVLDGKAPEGLLESYNDERVFAADENILNSTRGTDFITPKNPVSHAFRDAVLELSENYSFARGLVNSGRLSVPAVLTDSPLNTPDGDIFGGAMAPGAPAVDAPVERDGQAGWLLDELGNRFHGLYFAGQSVDDPTAAALASLAEAPIPIHALIVTDHPLDTPRDLPTLVDVKGLVAQRYSGLPGTFYLLRPDQHVAGRWRKFASAEVKVALARATAQKD